MCFIYGKITQMLPVCTKCLQLCPKIVCPGVPRRAQACPGLHEPKLKLGTPGHNIGASVWEPNIFF